jgi:RNA polymerase sigma-70 factor (ECF subfamily)
MDDACILAIYKGDEARGLRLLYDAYYEVLLLHARGITGDTGAAEDVVQECFISLWASRRLLALDGGLEAYLFQAVRYASFNHARGRRRRQLHEAASRETTATGSQAADMELLLAAINRLPGKRREIFLMICVDGMPYREVAAALDVSLNTVKTQMARAVKFLREHLRDSLFSLLLCWISRPVPAAGHATNNHREGGRSPFHEIGSLMKQLLLAGLLGALATSCEVSPYDKSTYTTFPETVTLTGVNLVRDSMIYTYPRLQVSDSTCCIEDHSVEKIFHLYTFPGPGRYLPPPARGPGK